ncbi:MAG: pyridoxal phosphate-dependent aminotransferase [Oscillospiraceae bacterium]|nr:pyridoxal phosphate-dependent aminotransferase [Oscillospiraceae bacterium]MDY5642235.1 pyridoxal phosphate-dependent aminotransferase [Candidatus Faecousia sp.]
MQISINANRCEPSPMRKFHPLAVAAEKRGKKIYHLNIGQPDLATPPAYFEAVRKFDSRTLAYDASPGNPGLIEAIRRYYKRLDVDLDPGDILITTGGSEALLLTCLSILDPYTEVIIPEPYYPNYTTFVHAAGGVIRALPTNPWEGYRYAKRERIESLITKNTRAILITNPGNPTGVVLDENEMRMIADIAKAHDLYLICDEVYREFCYNEKFGVPTMARFPDIRENLVIVDSVSKRFSACGARVGCVVTKNKELQQAILKFCQSRLSVATIDQIGAEALYSVDPEFFRKSKQEYRLRRDAVISGLRKIPGVVVEEPMGAFYVMASLPVDDADKFQHWLLETFDDDGDTVMFAPGAPFYETPGKGINEVRIAYVLNREDLNRAMEVLAKGIARYQREVMQINPQPLG